MSQDQGMDVSPSWQELKDERDAAHAAKTNAEEAELSAAQELDEVKAERDALQETARLAERFVRVKGRHHSQHAMCDLLEHFGLPCVRPGGGS